jgi:hypothetical protein
MAMASMDNPAFLEDFPVKTSVDRGFSIAMRRVTKNIGINGLRNVFLDMELAVPLGNFR